jgi:hypothetical protein
MTGAYLRVRRGDKWENIEIEHLKSSERAQVLGNRTEGELLHWIDMLCDKLIEVEELLIQLENEGIVERK